MRSRRWRSTRGYTCSINAPDWQELDRVAKVAVDAIRPLYNTVYTWGDSCNTIYLTSGGSDDWTYGGLGVVYSYCFEGRDTGRFGFNLPPQQIRPSGEENVAAVLAMCDEIAKKY